MNVLSHLLQKAKNLAISTLDKPYYTNNLVKFTFEVLPCQKASCDLLHLN